MTTPTSPAATRSSRATRAAYGLFAGAVAVLLVTRFVLVDEHVREDRDGSIHYWTTYPFGERAADTAIDVLTALAVATVLALVVAALVGPVPAWWRRPPDVAYGPDTGLLVGYAVLVTVVYGLWSLPHLGYDEPMDTRTRIDLGIGVVSAAAAVRASSWALRAPLGLIAAVLVTNASGEASLLVVHGALAITLGCLLLLARRTTRGWVRGLAILAIVAGVLLWLWLFVVISLFVTCEYTGGCLS